MVEPLSSNPRIRDPLADLRARVASGEVLPHVAAQRLVQAFVTDQGRNVATATTES